MASPMDKLFEAFWELEPEVTLGPDRLLDIKVAWRIRFSFTAPPILMSKTAPVPVKV